MTPDCLKHSDCLETGYCFSGTCVSPAFPGDPCVGGSCSPPLECYGLSKRCVDSNDFMPRTSGCKFEYDCPQEEYCHPAQKSCKPRVKLSGSCGMTKPCVDGLDCYQGKCYQRCISDTDCKSGTCAKFLGNYYHLCYSKPSVNPPKPPQKPASPPPADPKPVNEPVSPGGSSVPQYPSESTSQGWGPGLNYQTWWIIPGGILLLLAILLVFYICLRIYRSYSSPKPKPAPFSFDSQPPPPPMMIPPSPPYQNLMYHPPPPPSSPSSPSNFHQPWSASPMYSPSMASPLVEKSGGPYYPPPNYDESTQNVGEKE